MILVVVELPMTEMRFHQGKLLHSLDEDLWWQPQNMWTNKYMLDLWLIAGGILQSLGAMPQGMMGGLCLTLCLVCHRQAASLGEHLCFLFCFFRTDHRWGIVLQALMLSTQLLRSAPLVPISGLADEHPAGILL